MKFLGTLCLIAGLCMAAVGAFLYLDDTHFGKDYIKTEATIYNISNVNDKNTAFVQFFVDGEKYIGQLNYYSSSMEVNQRVEIYYNPDNPSKFRGGGFEITYLVIAGLGVVFFIGGIVAVSSSDKSSRRKRRAMRYNHVIEANITGIKPNFDVTIKGETPFVLEANIQNQKDGRYYYFRSDNFMKDLSGIVNQINIKKIPVYVNPNNFNEYYVDLEPIIKHIEKD